MECHGTLVCIQGLACRLLGVAGALKLLELSRGYPCGIELGAYLGVVPLLTAVKAAARAPSRSLR